MRLPNQTIAAISEAMAISFHPDPGTILICDFSTGFQPPEMVKIRPVVVISPRRRVGSALTVVPLSSVPPVPLEPWHYLLPPGSYPPARSDMWAKCDMVTTVSPARLDRVKTKINGDRVYQVFRLPDPGLDAIRAAVKAALGLA